MNKERISASGYMMYPKNYREVANELDEIFMNIYNSKETNSQFDKTIAKHVIDNYELVESKYIFNVYYKE